LTPKELLPTGNLLCGISFSIGSLSGPFLGGLFIQIFETVSFLVLVALLLGTLTCILFFANPQKRRKLDEPTLY